MSDSNEDSRTPRFAPVILAGGSGTRFWPRSRRARAKQVLALDGERDHDSADAQLVCYSRSPTLATSGSSPIACSTRPSPNQMPSVDPAHILSEPAARNTAPACALAAFLLESKSNQTPLSASSPQTTSSRTWRPLRRSPSRVGIDIAASGECIVVLGVPPTRPETGYGYIEQGALGRRSRIALDGDRRQ